MNIEKKITLLDIGARDGLGWPWKDMENELSVILVEPDPAESQRLIKEYDCQILPYALWNRQSNLQLNINKSPGTSSVYEANIDFLEQFDKSDNFKKIDELNVDARTIDSLAEEGQVGNIDFVKIDVQGAEKNILEGGQHFLRENVLGIEVEVEFAQIYKEQPLFSNVDEFIRKNIGLELWDIRKTYFKYGGKGYDAPLKGRLIFGDALYLRSVEEIEDWLASKDTHEAKHKVSSLIDISIAYGFLDYSLAILGSDFCKKYLSKEEIFDRSAEVDKLISSAFYPFKNGNSFLYRFFRLLMKSVEPRWGNSDLFLGLKVKKKFWL